MTNTKIESLLREVSVIQKHYSEIARLSGENFNVFKILNLATNEVRTHSSFLAELLNPVGSHNQGTVYLKLFINRINSSLSVKNQLSGFVFDGAKVIVEKRIGYKNDSKTEGGNIDILIKDINGYEIIIENKINAGDQENQLIRYSNYIKRKKGLLLYLNLHGHEASQYSTEDKNANISLQINIDYFVISYRDFIIEWLEECHKEAASHAIIRETIQQYIYLIKHLTGRSINKVMEEQLVQILAKDSESVKNAFNISASIGKLKEYLIKEFINQLKGLENNLGAEIKFEGIFGNYESECILFLLNIKNGNFYISLGFDEVGDFGIGVDIKNRSDFNNEEIGNLKSAISKKISEDYKPDRLLPNWLYYHYFDKESSLLLDFNNVEFLTQIPNRELITKFSQIFSVIKNSLSALE